MKNIIKNMSKYRKSASIFLDIIFMFLAVLISNLFFSIGQTQIIFKNFILQSIVYISVFSIFKIYNKLWRCANIKYLSICFFISMFTGAIYNIYLFNIYNIDFDYCLLNIILSTLFLCGYRVVYIPVRKILTMFLAQMSENNSDNINQKYNTLILENEINLDKLALQVMTLSKNVYNIKGIVTDSPFVVGTTLNGVKILGLFPDIKKICLEKEIQKILVSSDLLANKAVLEMLNNIVQTSDIKLLKFNTIDNLENFSKSKFNIDNIDVADLLGRRIIDIKVSDIDFIKNKTVLVTGGGGSIGSELCRQIASYGPRKLIILDNYENNAYSIEQELKRIYGDSVSVSVEIASVQDSDKIERIFRIYRPELVFHAAAHKHVPLMEHSPEEAVKNNVFGTLNVVKMSDKYNVEKFVLISTDKAVNPTNIMGATKRITEMIIQYYSVFSCTNFVAVRFGNVLGSNGSVIPLFKKQIESGGPVTVTHPNVVRYFMTISEAVGLILQAGEIAKGGEIFVLDMGEPVKITKLAESMIKLAGLTLGKDINIEYIGLRPGEKLYEELLMNEEGLKKTANNKIFIGKPIDFDMKQFVKNLDELRILATNNDSDEIFRFMPTIVETYKNADIFNKEIATIKKAI